MRLKVFGLDAGGRKVVFAVGEAGDLAQSLRARVELCWNFATA